MRKFFSVLVFLHFILCSTSAQNSGTIAQHSIRITLTEKGSNDAITMANCIINPLGAYATTDTDGKAIINNVPKGEYTLNISYIGYEKFRANIIVNKDLDMRIQLIPTSLALKEVVVTAKQNASGTSSGAIIEQQAIDHLQATNLADILQLVPGQILGNKDMMSHTPLQLRSLSYNSNNAFGSSIIVDGMPMSNNGILSQGGYSSTAMVGTDLRQIAADDIDYVEVVTGIPSAEYGDLTSGLVVVHSKTGITPWQAKGKINPEIQNYSLGKGFSLGKAGVLNFSADYAQAWGDPRQKTRSYHRYNVSIGYGYNITKGWRTDTKLRYMQMKDWNGKDPDAINDGTDYRSKNTAWSLTHNGKISVNLPLMRTLGYTLGFSTTRSESRNSSFVSSGSGLIPIITAMETGYHHVPWLTSSYLATGISESLPHNFFAKINDSFYHKWGKTHHSFKVGMEYRNDWNSGKGYYNADEMRPFRANSGGRPRAFNDIPGLHQLSAFAEDNLTWNINKTNRLRAGFGLRLTSLQPFSNVATTALSPRLNLSFSLTRWLEIRGGFGLNSKTPGLDYLYPDKKYNDRVAANYMPQNDGVAQLLTYHTQVYDVKRSKGLRNATTTKYELGIDIRLPQGRKFSILAYHDKTPNGFGSDTEYFTYTSNVYNTTAGLITSPGMPTTIDFSNPARQDIVFMTTGKIANTSTSVNKGIEFDFNLGEIKPLHTTVFFSGAYTESKTWSTDLNSQSVRNALLPSSYTAYGLTPFKVVYPSNLDYNIQRRFVNTLRLVTNIPSLRMVASFMAQAIFYQYSLDYISDKDPIGWIGTDLIRHDITPDMMGGYLTLDGQYHATAPTGTTAIRVSDLSTSVTDAIPNKTPITWNILARLTKEFGNIGGLSLYVNNMLFYEPFLKGNNTNTLTQRNTGNFSYGVELFFKL